MSILLSGPRRWVILSRERVSPFDTDTVPYAVNGTYNKDVYRYCAGYQYKDATIVGFSHTHLSGTGHSDLGDFLIAPRLNKENIYIQSVMLNGTPLNKTWFTHSDIINGGEIIFRMGSKPNKKWGTGSDSKPYSLSDMK